MLHTWLFLLSVIVVAAAQEQVCYSPGSIALSVILSILCTGLALFAIFYLYKKFRKPAAQHLILETDPERGKADYVFDNPGFKDATLTPNALEKDKVYGGKHIWSPLTAFTKSEKKKILDDNAVDGNVVKVVALRSHDFTGLGFNISGNMKEGIYIKDILNRGPASESRKLNPGDRINSVTISFEHIVYEDALTILSYASPYEVIIEARSGKIHHGYGQSAHPSHPVYRSSSHTNIFQDNGTKRKLFEDPSPIPSTYSTLQKTKSNMTTLERTDSPNSKLPKPEPKPLVEPPASEVPDHQKTEQKLQKFGVRVLPSPKHSELSQNDNNINLELGGRDEVDVRKKQPATSEPEFVREDVLNSSGIRRDANGIPQDIPEFMLNAAVAARTNRRPSEVKEDEERTVKKLKGKAPSPPDVIHQDTAATFKDYNSDSDIENDEAASVNTIELNANEITIHHSEETDERQNRKTASTGDLTKIQRTRKGSGGTLERAQSLDITDTGIALKRKADDDLNLDEDDALGTGIVTKEPRLSLILDGLNTFQRHRLKKSTEWGNLEDAISRVNPDEEDDAAELDALVKKVDEIKRESMAEPITKTKNQIWPVLGTGVTANGGTDPVVVVKRQRKPPSLETSEVVGGLKQVPEDNKSDDGKKTREVIDLTRTFLLTETLAAAQRGDSLGYLSKIADTNVSDDIKVSRHTMGSLERASSCDDAKMNVSNVVVNNLPVDDEVSSELYTTAFDRTLTPDLSPERSKITISTPDIIQNVSLAEAINNLNNESLTLEISSLELNPEFSTRDDSGSVTDSSLTYVTEIQVVTPHSNISEIEIIPTARDLDHEFEAYVRKFEYDSPPRPDQSLTYPDVEEQLSKIHEIAEEQLKKLPEMRFSTSSYEPVKSTSEKRQFEMIRSNFEKTTPPKGGAKVETKSRIPIATAKTPPTSPERRDSRNLEQDVEVLELMSSAAQAHSTPLVGRGSKGGMKNVTVTSIRNNSKIPSGLPVLTGGMRPPIPPRKHEGDGGEALVQISANGNVESFKQWVFNPADSVTNIVVTESKTAQK